MSFPGDGTVKTYQLTDILGSFDRQVRYSLNQKTLKFDPIQDDVYPALRNQQATVLKSFTVYSSPSVKKPDIALKKGEKLTRTGTDGKSWVRCKTGAGKVFWIKAAAEDPSSEWLYYSLIDGYGSMYDYLKGFDFYG